MGHNSSVADEKVKEFQEKLSGADEKVKVFQEKLSGADEKVKDFQTKLQKSREELDKFKAEEKKAKERKLKTPWRSLPRGGNWDSQFRDKLIDDISQQKAYGKLPHYRILFMGPIMAGKSSFINTIASIDHRRIAKPMTTGVESFSVSKALKQYKAKEILKNFIMMDTMGVEDNEGEGFHVQDIIYIMEGHVKPSYTFNPRNPLTESNKHFKAKPAPADKAHCIAIVIPAPLVHNNAISDASKKKLKVLKEHIRSRDLPIVILLSKIDLVDDELKENVSHVYLSRPVQLAVEKASELFGVTENEIFPVRNYAKDQDLDENIDILALLALYRMLTMASDRLEQDDDNVDDDELSAQAENLEL